MKRIALILAALLAGLAAAQSASAQDRWRHRDRDRDRGPIVIERNNGSNNTALSVLTTLMLLKGLSEKQQDPYLETPPRLGQRSLK
jgi:hypothetical protein